ncbi:MAG: peptidoglycan-binding protein [Candidatus Paceibacterota bacterium]|jgi:N-acetylmuramoyl-L-alanine amidase
MSLKKNYRSVFIFALLVGISFMTEANAESAVAGGAAQEPKPEKAIKILIVPGHDGISSGASFHGVREADLNMEMSKELFDLFRDDKKFDVMLARNGIFFTNVFQNYFTEKKADILEFIRAHEEAMDNFIQRGLVEVHQSVPHNRAPDDTRLKLFGINKWVNENGIDLVIHVHFNEYRNGTATKTGKYSGFVIYVPEKQYPNATATMPIAQSVYDRLTLFFAQSDMPEESAGVVEDQELIAVGASKSLDTAAAMLIEYGYLYEPQFIDEKIRPLAFKKLAAQTYLGIQKYFNKEYSEPDKSAGFPYQWKRNVSLKMKNDKDVFALQIALTEENLYPPKNKSKNDCPASGYFGNCTLLAVKQFQKKYNIPQTGFVGKLTRKKLNALYGGINDA